MVDEFNRLMEIGDHVIRLKLIDEENGYVEIGLRDDIYLSENNVVYANDVFYSRLESFFGHYGIALSYNNLGNM